MKKLLKLVLYFIVIINTACNSDQVKSPNKSNLSHSEYLQVELHNVKLKEIISKYLKRSEEHISRGFKEDYLLILSIHENRYQKDVIIDHFLKNVKSGFFSKDYIAHTPIYYTTYKKVPIYICYGYSSFMMEPLFKFQHNNRCIQDFRLKTETEEWSTWLIEPSSLVWKATFSNYNDEYVDVQEYESIMECYKSIDIDSTCYEYYLQFKQKDERYNDSLNRIMQRQIDSIEAANNKVGKD